MTLDNDAVFKAYSNVKSIRGDVAFDESGNKVTLVQSNIDSARTTLNTEAAAVAYKGKRANEYPSVVDQLDDIYHNGIDAWKATIKATKDKYPKP
tara:strand:- start:210 stop:494 length:285 start_codon:yes stop_codon:yes gene_type:complete